MASGPPKSMCSKNQSEGCYCESIEDQSPIPSYSSELRGKKIFHKTHIQADLIASLKGLDTTVLGSLIKESCRDFKLEAGKVWGEKSPRLAMMKAGHRH